MDQSTSRRPARSRWKGDRSKAKPRARKGDRRPTVEDIVEAVKECYADRVKPYGRILRKLCSSNGQSLELLREHCEACAQLIVEGERGGEWSVSLPGQPAKFVDYYSPEDTYSEHIWLGFAEFIDGLDDQAELPGGRYDCARELRKRVPCLSDLSLGEVCHIVELAIKHRRLLGYKVSGGKEPAIAAYKHSEKKVKDDQARKGQPSTVVAAAGTATWETLPGQLKDVLKQSHPEPISLSNIKRVFQMHTGVHLDQTALGVSRLSDLLADERLKSVCEVELTGTGYFVLPVPENSHSQLVTVLDADGEARAAVHQDQVAQRYKFPSWSQESLHSGDFAHSLQADVSPTAGGVKNTFIHVGVSPTAAPRSKSLPKSAGSARDPQESIFQALHCKPPAIDSQ